MTGEEDGRDYHFVSRCHSLYCRVLVKRLFWKTNDRGHNDDLACKKLDVNNWTSKSHWFSTRVIFGSLFQYTTNNILFREKMEEIQKNGGFLENAEFSGETSFSPSYNVLPTNIFPTLYSYPRFKLLLKFSPPSNLRHAPISKYFNHPPHTWPQAICMEQQQQRFTMFLMPVKYCFLGRNLIFLWKARSASWISTYRGWKRWQPKISCPIRKYHHHHQFYQSKILISIILSLKTSWRWKQQGGSTHDWFL